MLEVPEYNASDEEWSKFLDGRCAEYHKRNLRGKYTLQEYLGMTDIEFESWQTSGKVFHRVRHIWKIK